MAFNKRWLVLALSLGITIIYMTNTASYTPNSLEESYDSFDRNVQKYFTGYVPNWRGLTPNETEALSKMGRIMYLNEELPSPREHDRPYKILVWKYGETIDNRHVKHFSNKRHNPFEDCSVNNCDLTYKDEEISSADIVIIHLHRTKGVNDLPPRKNRSSNQIWAFLTDESPYHTFLQSKSKLKDFNGIFNWSMTYSMKSDIPVPYGRAIFKKSPVNFAVMQEFDNWIRSRKTDVLVAIMGSNCGSRNHRWEYVKELKEYIKVDAYGACGTLKCPGHFGSDCSKLNNYLFYLAFENSNCDDYLTEKVWWNAYSKNAIPIVMGSENSNLRKQLPPQSYLSVEDFASPRDLANYLIYLSRTPSELLTYFAWKAKYTILNEHGYFKSNSYHYCRVCEALNYNERKSKVYNDLESFWSTDMCYQPWDAK